MALEDVIESHVCSLECSLEANMRVTNSIPLGHFLTSSHYKFRPNTKGLIKANMPKPKITPLRVVVVMVGNGGGGNGGGNGGGGGGGRVVRLSIADDAV